MTRTYRAAGVDTGLAAEAVQRIARAAAVSATPSVLGGVGGFGGLFRFDPSRFRDPVLVSSTDGIGTKLKVAVALDALDTLGVELTAAARAMRCTASAANPVSTPAAR